MRSKDRDQNKLRDDQPRTDDRADKELPVTGEVGSEGGSFADPTYQVSEFKGDLGRTAEAVEAETTDAQTVDSTKFPTDS